MTIDFWQVCHKILALLDFMSAWYEIQPFQNCSAYHWSHAQCLFSFQEFVTEVLKTIELDEARDTLVGFPGANGLSTEQRKRLTIAVELVSNPCIIFLDEPTSGLDARAAAIVMRAVKNVADTGRTVACTIHQPSIEVFEAFDEVIITTGFLQIRRLRLLQFLLVDGGRNSNDIWRGVAVIFTWTEAFPCYYLAPYRKSRTICTMFIVECCAWWMVGRRVGGKFSSIYSVLSTVGVTTFANNLTNQILKVVNWILTNDQA